MGISISMEREGRRRIHAALLKLGATPLDQSEPYYEATFTERGEVVDRLNVLPVIERLAALADDGPHS